MKWSDTALKLALVCSSLLVACGGSGGGGGNQAPTASFGGPGASLPASSMSLAGATIQFDIVANDPDDDAALTIFADVDGDLTTLTDQVPIADGLEDKDGDLQSIPWNTAGVTPGNYKLVALLADGENPDVTVISDGTLTIVEVTDSTPTGTLNSTAESLRINFDQAIPNAAASALTIPVLFNNQPVDGTYTLIEDGLAVRFTPTAGSFEAPGVVRFEVRSNLLLESSSLPIAVFSDLFSTRTSRVYAASASSPSILVLNSLTMNELEQIAIENDTVLGAGVSTQDGLMFFAARPEGLSPTSSKLIPFDSATSSVLASVQLMPGPLGSTLRLEGLALSPNEEFLYCAVSEGSRFDDPAATPYLAIVQVATRTELSRIRLTGTGRVTSVAISPDGTLAFLSNIDSNRIHVVHLVGETEIDTDGISSNGITSMPTASSAPFDLQLNQDGSRLYVSFNTTFGMPATSLPGTPDISTYDPASFAETSPLASNALADAGSKIYFNSSDGLLYALRSAYLNGEALSVMNPLTNEETLISFGGTPNVVTSITSLAGTTRSLVSTDGGELFVVDSQDLGSSPTLLQTTLSSIASVVTIPAKRVLPSNGATPNRPPSCFAGAASVIDPGNLTVNFDGTGSYDPDVGDAIESYEWEFGDGQTVTTNEPTTSHTYSTVGNYDVTLTVSDGELTSASKTAVYSNTPPICIPGPTVFTTVNVPVMLDASGSSDPNGVITTYLWEFSDGQVANSVAPTLTFESPATSLGVLTVTDNAGASSSCTFSVNVSNTQPTCSIISTPGGTTEDSLVYDGSLSSGEDVDDPIVLFEWDFESDGTIDATGAQVFHTFALPDTYSVKLIVTDSFGAQSECTTLIDIIDAAVTKGL